MKALHALVALHVRKPRRCCRGWRRCCWRVSSPASVQATLRASTGDPAPLLLLTESPGGLSLRCMQRVQYRNSAAVQSCSSMHSVSCFSCAFPHDFVALQPHIGGLKGRCLHLHAQEPSQALNCQAARASMAPASASPATDVIMCSAGSCCGRWCFRHFCWRCTRQGGMACRLSKKLRAATTGTRR